MEAQLIISIIAVLVIIVAAILVIRSRVRDTHDLTEADIKASSNIPTIRVQFELAEAEKLKIHYEAIIKDNGSNPLIVMIAEDGLIATERLIHVYKQILEYRRGKDRNDTGTLRKH